MKNALKSKSKALSKVPQTRDEAVYTIRRIGELRQEVATHKAHADQIVRLAGEKLEADTKHLLEELDQHERGLQTYCEANRNTLTHEGKVKFHEFGTGRVNWRSRPPRVSVRAVEQVIEACKKLGLPFVRVKEEINKEAMLADPERARLVPGVTISTEGEDFVIEPAEISAPQSFNA